MRRYKAVTFQHSWDVSTEEVQSVQRRLAAQVDCTNAIPEHPALVAGVDMSPHDASGWAVAR